MLKCLTSELRLETATHLPEVPEKLRGSIASQNLEEDRFHQHSDSGLFYRYPRIHYHVLNGLATVTGWLEGVEMTKRLFQQTSSLQIENRSHKVIRKELKITEQDYGLTTEKIRYMFISPWLALNSGNYRKYQGYSKTLKKEFLEKILIGNLLSVSKGLNYTVPGRINVSIIYLRPRKCILKGTPVIGFTGAFEVNFALPNLLGLGKSVSRGFGAVKKI